MPAQWTTDQVLALAPDAGSAQSGKGLATPRKWASLGRNAAAVWGECQGSGAKPYQARIELSEPAFKCTCPSRKFPCKHALGLFLIYAQAPAALAEGDAPAWVAEWLEGRASRAQKKTERETEGKATPDPAQQAKRATQRQGRVDQGAEELDLWLRDLVRHGLAWAQSQPMKFWTGMAARMVDAQAPGLARQVRELALIPSSGEGWPARLLERLARLHLLLQGWRRIDQLAPETREDVRAAIGFTQSQDEVLAQAGVSDRWLALSQETEEDDSGLRTQRTWLWGEQSRRAALILAFAHRSAPVFELSLPPGTTHEGEIVYYPSAAPLRAAFKGHQTVEWRPRDSLGGYSRILDALAAYADTLANCPWIEQFPLLLSAVQPMRRGGRWCLLDREGIVLPIKLHDGACWVLLSCCGGRPCDVFGEWDGSQLRVLGFLAEGRYYMFQDGIFILASHAPEEGGARD
jgi:hypothetical protein